MGASQASAARSRRRRRWVPPTAVLAALVVAVGALCATVVVRLYGDGEPEWEPVAQGPFSPLTAGRPVDAEIDAGEDGAATSGLVLHNQGAEPVRLHAVDAEQIGEGVEDVRALLEVDGATLAPAGEPRSALEVPIGITLRPGAERGSVGGFTVRFETAAGHFEMSIDHRLVARRSR